MLVLLLALPIKPVVARASRRSKKRAAHLSRGRLEAERASKLSLWRFRFNIRMEKLLQLLNEYDKDSMRTEKSVYAHETRVISKKF